VPFQKLGVATSNLTFFRQIGGSIGLAIAGTAFATSLREQVPAQVNPVFGEIRETVPPAFQGAFDQLGQSATGGGQGLDISQLTGVGQSFGQAISDVASSMAGSAAPQVKAIFEPFIGRLDHAFFQAFSLAIGQTFFIGVATTATAVLAALVMRELPLRRTMGAAPASATTDGAAGATAGHAEDRERRTPGLAGGRAVD
jgi:hypothetical protein